MEKFADKLNLYIILPIATVFSYLVPEQVAYSLLVALVLLISVDVLTALSLNLKGGTLSSKRLSKGIFLKLINYGAAIVLASTLEFMIEVQYFPTGGLVLRTALTGLALSEAVSIAENLSQQGIKLPGIIIKVLDFLKLKNDEADVKETK